MAENRLDFKKERQKKLRPQAQRRKSDLRRP
jgi:hypothetical protein